MMRTIRHMVLALCSVFILCGTVHAAEHLIIRIMSSQSVK